MDLDESARLLTISCRFVPYDQWLTTHLDSSWKISQVKDWILSRCGVSQAPDAPRYRAGSPITFAMMKKSSSDSGSEGDDDDNIDKGSQDITLIDDTSEFSRHASLDMSSDSHVVRPTSEDWDSTIMASDERARQYTQFVLISFSTSQILEDDFTVSWYKLRPYELLELHRARSPFMLSRYDITQYAQPSFDAHIKVLRVTGREREKDRDGHPAPKGSRKGRLEWRDRWLYIQAGALWMIGDPSQESSSSVTSYSLNSLCHIRGAEFLFSHLKVSEDRHIVCAKFQSLSEWQRKGGVGTGGASGSSSHYRNQPHLHPYGTANSQGVHRNQSLGSMPSSPTDSGSNEWHTSGHHSRPENPRKDSRKHGVEYDWLIMDMLDDNAYNCVLRVLHRHAPASTPSSFLPSQRHSSSSNTPPKPSKGSDPHHHRQQHLSPDQPAASGSVSTPVSDTTVVPPTSPLVPTHAFADISLGSLGALPYPEWRLKTAKRARRAGMGDVGRPVDIMIWGNANPGRSRPSSPSLRSNSRALSPSGHNGWFGSTDLNDDSDMDSDVEWEGWARDLTRQRQVAEEPLSSSSSTSPSSPTAAAAAVFFAQTNKVGGGDDGGALGGRDGGSGGGGGNSGGGGFMSEEREMRDRFNDRMMRAERRAFEPSAEIIIESGGANSSHHHRRVGETTSMPASLASDSVHSFGSGGGDSSFSHSSTHPGTRPKLVRPKTATTSFVTVGTAAAVEGSGGNDKRKAKARTRSSTITVGGLGILRGSKDKDNEGSGGHNKHQKPKLTLTFSPPISPSFGSSSSSSNAASSSQPGSSSNHNSGSGGGSSGVPFLRHARSGSSLCTGPSVMENLSEVDPALRTPVTAITAHPATGATSGTLAGDGLLIPSVDGSTGSGMNIRVNNRRKLAGFGIMKGVAERAEKLLGQGL